MKRCPSCDLERPDDWYRGGKEPCKGCGAKYNSAEVRRLADADRESRLEEIDAHWISRPGFSQNNAL